MFIPKKNLIISLFTTVLVSYGGVVQADESVVSFTPEGVGVASTGIDYVNAIPMPLPTMPGDGLLEAGPYISSSETGESGFSPGRAGSGEESPVVLFDDDQLQQLMEQLEENDTFTSDEYGTSDHVYTTSRVNDTNALPWRPVKKFPYRPAGKLFFKIGVDTFVCSAAMVKRGLVVTAAHCVTGFGGPWYTDWEFVPAYFNGNAPFGKWFVKTAWAISSYLLGTDTCLATAPGVVCENDVAILVLKFKKFDGVPYLAGDVTGYLGFGWNGYGFSGVSIVDGNEALVTQLGYPVSHDGGQQMQRTDSEGFTDGALVFNNVIGSRQTGGSSGGPWVVNFGEKAVLGGTTVGAESVSNVVVGVTSWGYTATLPKQQGASAFRDTNIKALVDAACIDTPSRCL